MNYSILLFYAKLEPIVLYDVEEFLKNGIKVYLYSFDDVTTYINSEILQKAMRDGQLRVGSVSYDKSFDRTIRYIDGLHCDARVLDFLDKNSSFNKEQYVLEHTDTTGHCVVKAGAGTGKTTTMIDRLMYLKHIDPSLHLEGIVMITFTNEAAVHMRTKLIQKLKSYYEVSRNVKYLNWTEEVSSMFIGTIHAFAKEFLVREGEQLGFHRGMEVRSYKGERKRAIIKYIDHFANTHKDSYEPFKNIPHYQVVNVIDKMIEKMNHKSIPLEEMLQFDFGYDTDQFHFLSKRVIVDVLKALHEIKREEETLEISDLIGRLSHMYSAVTELTMNIRYLFVDEFQDSDEAQVSFASWIGEAYKCQVFVVGDVKQSVYRFRGADYTSFWKFKKQASRYTALQEFALQKNYRSAPLLLEQFNLLFTKWGNRIDLFQYEKSDALLPGLIGAEGEGIVALPLEDNLQSLLLRLYKEDVVVLARSNSQVKELVHRIEEDGFFCEAKMSGAFYRSLPVREFYLLVRHFTHPSVSKDQFLFNQTSYSQNPLKWNDVLASYAPDEKNVLKVLENKKQMGAKAPLHVLEELISALKPHETYAKRFYSKMRQQFPQNEKEMQQKEAKIQMIEYKMNLDYLLYIIKKEFGDFKASFYDLEQFLKQKMTTDTDITELRIEEEVQHRIKVMTVHKSKGLEFDYVLLPLTNSPFIREGTTDILVVKEQHQWKLGYHVTWQGKSCRNNIFEQTIRSENEETIAEETRLLYVAMTRAKKAVFVHTNTKMRERGPIENWAHLLEGGEHLIVSR